MASSNPRIGLSLVASGGILTALSVYQPWYGIGFTQAAVGEAQQQISSLPGLAPYAERFGAAASTLTGRSVVALSAHQALHHISVILLIIAGAAILAALAGLVSGEPALPGGSAPLVSAAGVVGVLLTVFRVLDPPDPAPGLLTITLRPGVGIALAGCVGIVVGSLMSARAADAPHAAADPAALWSDLSGWTPS